MKKIIDGSKNERFWLLKVLAAIPAILSGSEVTCVFGYNISVRTVVSPRQNKIRQFSAVTVALDTA